MTKRYELPNDNKSFGDWLCLTSIPHPPGVYEKLNAPYKIRSIIDEPVDTFISHEVLQKVWSNLFWPKDVTMPREIVEQALVDAALNSGKFLICSECKKIFPKTEEHNCQKKLTE